MHLVALKAQGQTEVNAQGKISAFLVAVKQEVPPSSGPLQGSSLPPASCPIPSSSGWGLLGSCHTVHVTTGKHDEDERRK